MIFSDRLRELRGQKKISVTQLAAHLNKGESAVRMWETGRSNPDLETLLKVAEYFDCTTDYLLGRSNVRSEEDSRYIEEGAMIIYTILASVPDRDKSSVVSLFKYIRDILSEDGPSGEEKSWMVDCINRHAIQMYVLGLAAFSLRATVAVEDYSTNIVGKRNKLIALKSTVTDDAVAGINQIVKKAIEEADKALADKGIDVSLFDEYGHLRKDNEDNSPWWITSDDSKED